MGTAAKRNERISSALARRADFTKIFTATGNLDHNPEGVELERLKTYDYRFFLRRKTKDGALPEEKKQRGAIQAIVRLINTFPVNIIIGEGGFWYFRSLLKKAGKSIREEGITHIYSSYRPFTDHYAAYLLKRKYPHLVWIADFRDLIIDPHYRHIFFPKVHQGFFKKIFSKADILTTVSDGLADKLRKYNPNVITLRNYISHLPDPVPQHSKYFKICYTGSMFLDKRNAKPVFGAISSLIRENKMEPKDVRIVYAGKDSHDWRQLAAEHNLESILVDKGIVTAGESAAIQQSACINILLTVSSPELQGVLTGKMIEYFEAGSPVLAIVVGHNDPELSMLLQEVEIGSSFSDQKHDFASIKAFIEEEYIQWKRTGMNRKPVNISVLKSKYSMEVTMKPLYDKIFQPINPLKGTW